MSASKQHESFSTISWKKFALKRKQKQWIQITSRGIIIEAKDSRYNEKASINYLLREEIYKCTMLLKIFLAMRFPLFNWISFPRILFSSPLKVLLVNKEEENGQFCVVCDITNRCSFIHSTKYTRCTVNQ